MKCYHCKKEIKEGETYYTINKNVYSEQQKEFKELIVYCQLCMITLTKIMERALTLSVKVEN
jgi:hypothetical protein